MARLLSVNVGLPRDIEWKGRTVHTAIWKDPVRGRCRVRRLNLDGDGQGDLGGHGGEQRAVFVYQIDSYRHWQEQLKRTDFVHGQFGENFTIEGLPDDDVCIGDQYQIGSALFEVTQPRVTCYRVGIRMNEPRMPALLTSSGRPGFYLRVLREGEVGAGDDIVKVNEAKERMTVAEINALLYSSDHARERLERALRIEALSPGWHASFKALVQSQTTGAGTGNAGLAPAAAAHAAEPGFLPLTVTAIDQESVDVLSLTMRSTDGQPLRKALPGQYVVLRLQRTAGRPPLFRSYSLSGPLSTESYRISVKIEPDGAAGPYLREHVRVNDVLDVSSPRGSFMLQPAERPVVLLSAGIGATPVLAMLHALAAARSTRRVLWLHAARDRQHHPFAAEVRQLMLALPHGRSHVCYSRPEPGDTMGKDFDAAGHLSRTVFDEVGVPRDAEVYLCGPTRFMAQMKEALAGFGVKPERIHAEIFNGGEPLNPGVVGAVTRAPHLPKDDSDTGPLVSFARSGIAAHWKDSAYQSILELAEACDVPVRWSCRTGVCHNCESGLVSGSVTYQPDPLDPPAGGNVLICCARPQDGVVIDI
ncbi:Flavohemoprotein (Hemoglobin-like protein) (Flavohemoglobin) (Nitric oxide dioxygenase) [Caballeronia glathei]|uniref:nitric oxide dioxygenase n=1 Tax=Caballeronia glathei TaxID=60547 RepID=A0A069PFK2_9BURK|nr:MOSC and FAD-binding oxidoreductase domain-containing protein [Caballeronia glathei]KDR39468.1 sulfurase [Caballeronia glathei]CDY79387.1 Flavohemoprotein (Hemoglobin-like protein) (Flavohemoglobin) (Nitric oxide dioxygenase) [Caballeronia glathei]